MIEYDDVQWREKFVYLNQLIDWRMYKSVESNRLLNEGEWKYKSVAILKWDQ